MLKDNIILNLNRILLFNVPVNYGLYTATKAKMIQDTVNTRFFFSKIKNNNKITQCKKYLKWDQLYLKQSSSHYYVQVWSNGEVNSGAV